MSDSKKIRELKRSTKQRMIAGVAGGLGEYFLIDPLIFRLIFIILAFSNYPSAIVYLALWFLIPSGDSERKDLDTAVKDTVNEISVTAKDIGSNVSKSVNSTENRIVLGIVIVLGFAYWVRSYSWFRNLYSWDFLIPLALILFGIILIFRNREQ